MIPIWAITLQLQRIWQDLFPKSSDIPGVEVATPYLPYVGFAILIIIAFLGFRVYKNFTSFPNDEERIGKVNFVWMGHYKFSGNVSRWTEPLDETQLEFLEQDPKYSEAISKLIQLVNQKKLYVFQMKISEWDDAFDIKGKKEPWLIISSADIGHPDYSWEDIRGEFNWGTMRKEKPKYVICYEDSRYFDVMNVEGNIIDVMVISPIPRRTIGETGLSRIGIDDDELGHVSHILKVEKLQEMKALANVIPYLIPLAETTDLIKSKNIQVREYRKLVEDRDTIINKLQRDSDETRILAAEKPIIGEEAPPPAEPPGHPWVWFAIFGFAAIIGYKVPPSIAALQDLNPDISAILAVVIVGAIYALTHKKKREIETSMVET
jgi:hypothetical protein